MGVWSPAILGRDDELCTIRDAIDAARAGHGGSIFLVGESGIGKTRLAVAAAELAYAARMPLLRGRASAVGPSIPFRPLTEAVLSLLRVTKIDVAALGPYRPVLARLVPDLAPAAAPVEDSLVILAEAMLRLATLAGPDHGCLMTLDDLQDADAETLAVVEYLTDNLDRQPTLLLGTIRDEPCPALDLARSAAQRGGTLIQLHGLGVPDARRLAGDRLGVEPREVPDAVVELLWAGSAGNPLHINELLTGILDGGLLTHDGGSWRYTEQSPPMTFTRSVARRFDQLGPQARRVLSVAAVLGRRFPLTVLRAVTGLDYRDLLGHLHDEVAAQLVAPDDQTPDWYTFQHALIAEALLTLLDPAERTELARRAADAIEATYPGLPGAWCQTGAALRLDVGQTTAAGHLFAEAGRRALAQGAAHSAVELLDRAWHLLDSDVSARVDVLESQLYALAEAGLVDRALSAAGLLAEVGGIDPHRRARVHARLAWVCNVDGRAKEAAHQLETARSLLGESASAEDTVPVDVVAAYLQLDIPGSDHLNNAETMARRAAMAAERIPLPVAACQAWQLLGALLRARDPDEATACLERSRAVAARHGLPIWETHALVRLGADNALRTGSLDRIEQARREASRIGAVTARYQAEVNLATQLVLRGDYAAAETLIAQVLAAARRLKLVEITQLMVVARAVLAGHRGRRAEMESALAELNTWRCDLSQYAPRIHGLAKAFCALLTEDRPLATEELAAALRAEESNPTTFHLAGRYGLHLLLDALSGDLDWSRYEDITSTPASRLRWDRVFALFARAVLAGRAAGAEDATAAVGAAMRAAEPYPMARHLGLRLVGEAALDDGWGTPAKWLRAAERHFHAADVPAVTGACQALLRRTGERLAPRDLADIPQPMRSAGITTREYEVLRLLGKRLRNKEIAEMLYVSQRTVETHVSSLLAKTGLPNRIELGKLTTDD